MNAKELLGGILICGMLITTTPAMAMGEYYDNGNMCNEFTMDNGIMSTTLPMPVTVHVDGKYLPTDVNATIQNGRTLIPLRAAGEALGCKIDWDSASQTVTATKENHTVQFTLYSTVYYIDGQTQVTDIAPTIIQGRTMLPLRAFAEAFDTKIDWNSDLYDVSIDTPAINATTPDTDIASLLDAQKYIKKYYVTSNPSDPLVGNWHKIEYNYDLGTLTTHETFMFLSPYENGYQCISLSVSDSSSYSLDRIMVSKQSAQKLTKDSLRIINQGQILYYRGPNTGFIGEYIDDYSLINNQLQIIKSVFHIGNSYENVPLYNITPFNRF